MASPATVAELRSSGYPDRTVKEELRSNLVAKLGAGEKLFESIIGFDESVLPALERGILAGHDLIFLGERGQAKTRVIRRLVDLLDEASPSISGCEINDHPFHPICASCIAKVAAEGDRTAIEWVARDRRFAEKLATPDTSVADLIGDIDPIRVAEGRYLSDELSIHYGLIPRTNRGIFGINELPDLPERIQVSLLNILEERDVQIRGFKVRLPLDLLLVASANPEDYTHRGRIITPLKDRFGTQVRTHYPKEPAQEIQIMEAEARPPHAGIPVHVPAFMKEVVAQFTTELRASPKVNQRSGVSVRYSIGNLETLVAGAMRRAVRAGERIAVPRPVDLWALLESSAGRIEFETMEEGREPKILENAMKSAIAEVYRNRLGGENFRPLIERFEQGLAVETSDVLGAENFLAQLGTVPGLGRIMRKLDVAEESPENAASALEFALEGLHLMRRINKDSSGLGSWRFGA
ncbi:MAG: sigma 54-interacting transcriptional regulator [Actinomycetota bacterium]